MFSNSRVNLEEIGLAFHDDHGHLPGFVSVNASGKSLFSWRVHLLPHLGREAKTLPCSFHLDEP
ncbi:MAG: hypothetical protein Fues2KO_06370 [Fuerstiella sp.]